MKIFWPFTANVRRFGSSGASLIGLLCAISCMFFTSEVSIAQVTIQRDPQALTVLDQTISAGGGQQLLASIRDITQTGQITYGANSNAAQGNVVVKARGLHQIKIAADLSTGKRTIIVNGYGGSLIEADGRSVPLHGQSAVDFGSFTLPYLPLIAAMEDSSMSILYEGLVTHNNAPVYDIRIQRVYTKQQDPLGERTKRGIRDVYIDPKTSLIAAISDQFYLAGPKGHGLQHENLYSGYQSSNGIMMPLTVVQTVDGEIGFTLNIEQTAINSGLRDADFI